MPPVFICPNMGAPVQGWLAEEDPSEEAGEFCVQKRYRLDIDGIGLAVF
jgi:hypothetical protein